MSYRNWRLWLKGLDWPLKWFIILILVRPLIDNFYYLKEISPFLSPLYIVGVATPILAIYTIIKIPKPNYSRLDTLFGIYTLTVVVSCVAILISDSMSLDSLDLTFKFIFPSCVYFFCRRLILSKHDLHGVLQAFLYSTIFIILVFGYELIVNPISIQISRGFERYHGSFADVMNYSIYMTVGLLIIGYSIFERTKDSNPRKNIFLLIFAIFFSTLLLFKIHHTASYIVVSSLALLFFAHYLKANITMGVVIISFTAIFIYISGAETLSDKFLPLIETDIKVYEGEMGDEALMHGRMGRWMNFYEHFSNQSVLLQMFGLPLGMNNPYLYISKGSHNDFVRTVMFTGYIGLSVYLFLLFSLYRRISKFRVPQHFLGTGILAILCLYSITTTPLLYPSLLYVVIPLIAATAIPKELLD